MKHTSRINVTPYIDILLVLLIIFMVIQPDVRFSLDSRSVQRPTRELPVSASSIVLTVDSDLRMELNGQEVGLDALGSKLFEVFSARSDKRLFVRGSQDLPFGDIVRLIDIAKGAGVGDVGLIRI